jgi:hypothetical protein
MSKIYDYLEEKRRQRDAKRAEEAAKKDANMGEKGPGAGFEYPPYDVSWLKRDVLLFSNSIGATAHDELHFLYVSMPIIGVYLPSPPTLLIQQ